MEVARGGHLPSCKEQATEGEELQSDNKARKDEFNSFNPATIKVFLGANPARVERGKDRELCLFVSSRA